MSKSYACTTQGGQITFEDGTVYKVTNKVLTLEDKHAKEFDALLKSGERADLNQRYTPVDRAAAEQLALAHRASLMPATLGGILTAGHVEDQMIGAAASITEKAQKAEKPAADETKA